MKCVFGVSKLSIGAPQTVNYAHANQVEFGPIKLDNAQVKVNAGTDYGLSEVFRRVIRE